MTVTTWPLAGFSVTGNAASPPSATVAASAIDSPGIAFAAIVPTPVALVIVVPAGSLNSTLKFSLGSATASRSVGTRMVCIVSPGSKRSVPDVAV